MSADPDLVERVRAWFAGAGEIAIEKSMFGGVAFLVGGHMAVAASSREGLMVRVDPADTDRLVSEPGVEVTEMKGRTMTGWLDVAPDVLDDDAVARWCAIGRDFAATLPSR